MIKVKNLNFMFNKEKGLKDINLHLEKGNIYGLIGPNGTGKTTLLHLLSGTYKTKGKVEVLGNTNPLTFLNHISYFYDNENDLAITDNTDTRTKLLIFFKTYNNQDFFDKQYFLDNLKEFEIDITKYINDLRVVLSKGKLQIIRILFHLSFNKKIYLFDEPLTSLDIINKEKILNLIISKSTKDTTILISSHELTSLDSKIDYAILLNENKIVDIVDVDKIKTTHNLSLSEYFVKIFKKEGEINDQTK